MRTVRLPRVLNSDLSEITRLHPAKLTVEDRLTPLSTAEMELAVNERVKMRQLIELYTEDGSAGIFRVSDLGLRGGGIQTVTLQHGLTTLSDVTIPGEGEATGSLRTLLTQLLSNQTGAVQWTLGTVEVPDDEELTWQWAYSNGLESLVNLLAELPAYGLACDQSSLPWVLNVVALTTEVECECRLNRSLVDFNILWSDAEMCTRLYAPGIDEPFDADTQAEWGIIARPLQVDEELGEELIRKAALAELEKRKNPSAVITLTARALAAVTGLSVDRFRKGLMCRCCLPDEGLTLIQRIISVKHEDVYGDPGDVTLTLCTAAETAASAIAGLVVDTRYVRQWLQKIEKNLKLETETIDLIAQEIKLFARQSQVDGIATRLKTVEIDLNAAEAELLLKAAATDMEDALIRLSGLESEILLKADKVDIEGFLTVDDSAYIAGMLAGNDITCNALTANTSVWTEFISAYDIGATSLSADYINDHAVSWAEKSVLTGIGSITTNKDYVTVMLADGTTKGIHYVTGITIEPTRSTLKYLTYE